MNVRNLLIGTAACALVSAFAAETFAHESRLLPATHGKVRLTVGFAAEPAWEDSYNGVDVILNTYDHACHETPNGYYGAPIDPAATANSKEPDKVDLKVDALYLEKPLPPTGTYGSIPPSGVLKTLVLTEKSPLKAKFNTPGTFNTFFRPTHPGTYGFHVYGTIFAGPNVSTRCPGHTAPVPLARRTAHIDAYFICSAAGSFSPPSAFNCVETPQTFPGGPMGAYKPNGQPGS